MKLITTVLLLWIITTLFRFLVCDPIIFFLSKQNEENFIIFLKPSYRIPMRILTYMEQFTPIILAVFVNRIFVYLVSGSEEEEETIQKSIMLSRQSSMIG